jgi:hypothetical protein
VTELYYLFMGRGNFLAIVKYPYKLPEAVLIILLEQLTFHHHVTKSIIATSIYLLLSPPQFTLLAAGVFFAAVNTPWRKINPSDTLVPETQTHKHQL